ncbi:MAG TPA: phosphotransferase [Pirellulales bacterium]|nr:phosphotransferase [Pirellulales bacterium]
MSAELALSPVLAAYSSDCEPRRIENLGSAGGFSGARFWRLEAPRGFLCLRRWPAERPSARRLEFVHAVLDYVHRHGFFLLPLPIRTLSGKTTCSHFGHLWELTPWLPGAADYLPERKPEKLAAALTALARWHRAAAEFPQSDQQLAASPGNLSRLAQLEQLRSGGLTRLSIAVENRRGLPPFAAGTIASMVAELKGTVPLSVDGSQIGSNRPEWAELAGMAERLFALFFRVQRTVGERLISAASIRVPLQPCIRDVWHDHVLFEGDRVSGIIDFGALRLETVAGDVARLLGSLAGDDLEAREHGLAAYQAVRPLSDEELTLVRVFDESAMLLSGFNWLEWVFLSQREFEDPAEVVRRMRGILDRLEFCSSNRAFDLS